MPNEIFLPSLSHWQHENPWTGSQGLACFGVEVAQGVMTAQVWQGPKIKSLSQVEQEAQFPVGEEGIEALRQWLVEQCAAINQRKDPG